MNNKKERKYVWVPKSYTLSSPNYIISAKKVEVFYISKDELRTLFATHYDDTLSWKTNLRDLSWFPINDHFLFESSSSPILDSKSKVKMRKVIYGFVLSEEENE